MFRDIGRIIQGHDAALAGFALLICILATTASLRLLRGTETRRQGHRTARVAAAALVFSCGLWTARFVATSALVARLPTASGVALGVLSLLALAAPAQIGFSILAGKLAFPHGGKPHDPGSHLRPWQENAWWSPIAIGLLIVVGFALSHMVGMGSLQLPALARHNPGFVAVSLGIGALASVMAVRALFLNRVTAAVLLFTLAAAVLHLLATAATTLESAGESPVDLPVLSTWVQAFLVGGGCALILALSLLTLRRDWLSPLRMAAEAPRFRALADATFEGLIFERSGRITDANRTMCRMLGIDSQSLLGRPVATLISGGVSMHPSSLERPVEYELIQQDGGTRPVEVLWRIGTDPAGHVLAIRDISGEKSARQQIQHLANFDVLTGVGNRQLLEQTLLKILTPPDRVATGVALLCIDLDCFKALNDTWGPRVGDAVLVQAARRLRAVVADTDLVARVGGDEFAVIHSLAGKRSDSAALAERIVAGLAAPYDVDGQAITAGASVGVALFPADGTTTLALMTSGALALNRAKRDGRNTWRYCEPGMDYLLRERRALEGDLRTALVEEQFFLMYQPFFHADTLKIAGYEALLRWNHPTRGLIPPADFIPAAERCGLIVPLGQWLLRTACVEAASWDRPLLVAVNLSPAQFGTNIPPMVDAVLRETGLAPSLLELEITEGVLMGDTLNALQTLTALKALGVTLAMDDFGTGYSSLSYLRKFPFDKLKIDRSFVRDLDDGSDGRSIVQAIIALSSSLRLQVTAEGVETAHQLAVLRAAGCTFVQGFLLGRPMDAHLIGSADTLPLTPPVDGTAIRIPGKTLIPLFHQSALGTGAAMAPECPANVIGDLERLRAARSA